MVAPIQKGHEILTCQSASFISILELLFKLASLVSVTALEKSFMSVCVADIFEYVHVMLSPLFISVPMYRIWGRAVA
jgi:hypothetical protein